MVSELVKAFPVGCRVNAKMGNCDVVVHAIAALVLGQIARAMCEMDTYPLAKASFLQPGRDVFWSVQALLFVPWIRHECGAVLQNWVCSDLAHLS